MKCLVISYIKSEKNLAVVENILSYYGFSIIESNLNFRVFAGNPSSGIRSFIDKLNIELADLLFDIDDSICLVKPGNDKTQPNLSVIVIKRKGNKNLRNKMLFP